MLSNLVGLTLSKIEGATVGSDVINFVGENGRKFSMFHSQNCCEHVSVEDVIGDVADLIGSPIVRAEERVSTDEPTNNCYDSCTWTFYELATNKGSVTLRWLGTSNGYYSERVSFEECSNAAS